MSPTKKKITTAAIVAALLAIGQTTGILGEWFPIVVKVDVGTTIQSTSAPPQGETHEMR